MSKDTFIQFHRESPASHPIRRTMIHRVDISEVPETPAAADSSIAKFLPTDAILTRDSAGVTLRLASGDEIFWPYSSIQEARNVPVKK